MSESPSKKHRFDYGDAVSDSVDENEMDVEESAKEIENNEDQEMDAEEDSSSETSLPKIGKGGVENGSFVDWINDLSVEFQTI